MNPLSEPDATELTEHLRTQFLRRVAHDIASPSGVTLTVLDELASGDMPRPELLAMARRSMHRLMRLSDQLALVAELEASGLEPDLANVDLRELSRQAFDEALAIDGRRDVTASPQLPDEPVHATGDARLLLVVFREVLGNALKLASTRVEMSLTATDHGVTLRVDDDGPGFSSDSLENLGRRFVKRAAARGLGLSLSMGIEILRAHGGQLTVASSKLPPGRRGTPGAAVIVSLPSRGDSVSRAPEDRGGERQLVSTEGSALTAAPAPGPSP